MKNEEFYKREIIDFALDGYSFGLKMNWRIYQIGNKT